MPVCRFTVDTI